REESAIRRAQLLASPEADQGDSQLPSWWNGHGRKNADLLLREAEAELLLRTFGRPEIPFGRE
ncbi:MAG TPA: hypothetical protein VLH58_00315, partial [Candidatus Methylomirabilis sp.]|nr:hypothetical protein [Candidatus Methylomirabilis sp.]